MEDIPSGWEEEENINQEPLKDDKESLGLLADAIGNFNINSEIRN